VCQSHPLVRAARRANRARQKRRLAHVEAQGSGARDSTTPVHGGGAARRGMQRRFCSEEGWNSGSRTECFSGPGSVGLQSGRGVPAVGQAASSCPSSQGYSCETDPPRRMPRCLQSFGAPERSSSA
jgi:hypothetical protein